VGLYFSQNKHLHFDIKNKHPVVMSSFNNNQQPSSGKRSPIGLPRTPKKENAPPGESNDGPRRLLAPLDQNMPMPTSGQSRITTVSHLSPGGTHNETHSALVTDESYHTTVFKMVHALVEGEKAARQQEIAELKAANQQEISELKQKIAEMQRMIDTLLPLLSP
jgi:hypothetical protein